MARQRSFVFGCAVAIAMTLLLASCGDDDDGTEAIAAGDATQVTEPTATEPPSTTTASATTTAAKTATTTAPTSTTIPCIATAAVDIKGGYKPQCASVAPGTTVTWTWSDPVFAHSVTSDAAGLFDSGVLEPGSTFEHTFADAGTYQYHCTVHGRILHSGTIEVG
jgi:plastocyanin